MPRSGSTTPRRWVSARALLVLAVGALLVLSGCRYSIVGDSLTFDARDELEGRGAEVRAYGGVSITLGRPTIRALAAEGREKVVIALGQMDLSRGHRLRAIRDRVRAVMRHDIVGIDCVIWVDLPTRHSGLPNWATRARAFNAMLREMGPRHRVQVARWSRVANQHPRWFRADGIHLRPVGQQAYADFVTRSVGRRC